MNRKRLLKITLGAVVLLLVAAAMGFYNVFGPTIHQMRAGKKYMDSLTEPEIQKWIDRSKEYMATAAPNEDPIAARPVPAELKALEIQRIDLRTNSVVYVWTGGFDHTCLTVKSNNGRYEVIAVYDDHHSKVLWSKPAASHSP